MGIVINYIEYREKLMDKYIQSDCQDKRLAKMIDKIMQWKWNGRNK